MEEGGSYRKEEFTALAATPMLNLSHFIHLYTEMKLELLQLHPMHIGQLSGSASITCNMHVSITENYTGVVTH